MVLNDAQRDHIAQNRAAALARRAAKQQQEQQQQLDDYQEVLSKALLEDKVEASPNSVAAKSDDGKSLEGLKWFVLVGVFFGSNLTALFDRGQ